MNKKNEKNLEQEHVPYLHENMEKGMQNRLQEEQQSPEIEEALKVMATAIGNQYYAVYYIWLESRTYICFEEKLPGILSVIGEKGEFEPAWEKYINGYIEPEDREGVREYVEINTLAERIGRKTTLSHVYRRKGIGWTRGQFIVGKRDEQGNPQTLLYTVSDINDEMDSKKRRIRAEEEALQDPLTGVWNRKAFDLFKDEAEYRNHPTGFLLFDIDLFKGVNDRFGHEEGDRVLKSVVAAVSELIRPNDRLFRMGGDEFAILLHRCDEKFWKILCRKIETIHLGLKKHYLADVPTNITLSVGFCCNRAGYEDEMYSVADRALYHTKATGRAGSTFMDIAGNVLEEWHDNSIFLQKEDVLVKNDTLTWRLDKPRKKGLKHRTFGDELFCSFVGLKRDDPPEEIYKAWATRVEQDYFDLIKEAAQRAIADGKVEVIFLWNHPKEGLIQLRCSVSLEAVTEEYYSFVGYMHVITGMHIITMEDMDAKVKNALEELYFCNFLIRLSDYSFKTYKAQPYMAEMLGSSDNAVDAVASYIKYMVAEDYKDVMEAFLDLTTLSNRMKETNALEENYYDPNIGMSRAKFVVVDRNENGEPNIVSLVVEAV